MISLIAKSHNAILGFLDFRNENSIKSFLREFFCFGYKEAISCIFPAFILSLSLLTSKTFTNFIGTPGIESIIPRYDFLLLCCIAMQYAMWKIGLESSRELLVICVFHLLGVGMELFKVNHGSWAYKDFAYTKIYGVPLFSGFLYASVASYVCQAWRNFSLRFTRWPNKYVSRVLACWIYANFFLNHYIIDMRMVIIPFLLVLFYTTRVYFTTNSQERVMPLNLGFALIAFFVWLAENISTFVGIWSYPHQSKVWGIVKFSIASSWFLLVVVSVMIVYHLKSSETYKKTSHN